MALRLFAPAKVNLYLEVLGRRPDGYHEVETCLHALAFGDELVAELAGDRCEIQLVFEEQTDASVPAGEDNLVARAAAAFCDAAGVGRGVRFRLHKRVPAGAGLGGGSSDAAAALLLMNELHGRSLTAEELHGIASRLGADVPFFLRRGTQVGTGIGDVLQPLPDRLTLHFVLLLPPYGVSTAQVFARCGAARLTEDPAANRVCASKAAWYREQAVTGRFANNLESAAMAVEPRLFELREQVVRAGYPQVRMSGSGSTLFLAFDREAEAAAAREALSGLRDQGVGIVQTQSDHSAIDPVEVGGGSSCDTGREGAR